MKSTSLLVSLSFQFWKNSPDTLVFSFCSCTFLRPFCTCSDKRVEKYFSTVYQSSCTRLKSLSSWIHFNHLLYVWLSVWVGVKQTYHACFHTLEKKKANIHTQGKFSCPVDMRIVDRNRTLLLIQNYSWWFSAWALKVSLRVGPCFQISTTLILEQVILRSAVQIYFILQMLIGAWKDVLKARHQQSRIEKPNREDF